MPSNAPPLAATATPTVIVEESLTGQALREWAEAYAVDAH
jgi:hypothetical protein